MSRRLRELESLPAARWVVTLAWTALLFILLVQPDDQRLIETGIPRGPNTLPRELFFTAAHVLAFALTCIVWFRAIGCHLSPKRSLALALGMAIGIGALTEGLQAFSPERYPSLGDLAANCAGALLAARMIWRRTMVCGDGRGDAP